MQKIDSLKTHAKFTELIFEKILPNYKNSHDFLKLQLFIKDLKIIYVLIICFAKQNLILTIISILMIASLLVIIYYFYYENLIKRMNL